MKILSKRKLRVKEAGPLAVIYMCDDGNEYTIDQLAEMHGINVNTLRTRISRYPYGRDDIFKQAAMKRIRRANTLPTSSRREFRSDGSTLRTRTGKVIEITDYENNLIPTPPAATGKNILPVTMGVSMPPEDFKGVQKCLRILQKANAKNPMIRNSKQKTL